jgi:hypothetical protein
VTVAVVELGVDAATDAEGEFELPALPAGAYRLLVVQSGYDRFEERVSVADGEVVFVPRGDLETVPLPITLQLRVRWTGWKFAVMLLSASIMTVVAAEEGSATGPVHEMN